MPTPALQANAAAARALLAAAEGRGAVLDKAYATAAQVGFVRQTVALPPGTPSFGCGLSCGRSGRLASSFM